MEIIYEESDWGFASASIINGIKHIRINKNIKKWKWLYDYTIKHEEQHMSAYTGQSKILWAIGEFATDIKEAFNPKLIIMQILFLLRYPKAVSSCLPIVVYGERIFINLFTTTIWIAIFLVFILK